MFDDGPAARSINQNGELAEVDLAEHRAAWDALTTAGSTCTAWAPSASAPASR